MARGRLTWDNVSAATVDNPGSTILNAGALINNALSGFGDTLRKHQETADKEKAAKLTAAATARTAAADADALRLMAGLTSENAWRAAMANGALDNLDLANLSTDMQESLLGRQQEFADITNTNAQGQERQATATDLLSQTGKRNLLAPLEYEQKEQANTKAKYEFNKTVADDNRETQADILAQHLYDSTGSARGGKQGLIDLNIQDPKLREAVKAKLETQDYSVDDLARDNFLQAPENAKYGVVFKHLDDQQELDDMAISGNIVYRIADAYEGGIADDNDAYAGMVSNFEKAWEAGGHAQSPGRMRRLIDKVKTQYPNVDDRLIETSLMLGIEAGYLPGDWSEQRLSTGLAELVGSFASDPKQWKMIQATIGEYNKRKEERSNWKANLEAEIDAQVHAGSKGAEEARWNAHRRAEGYLNRGMGTVSQKPLNVNEELQRALLSALHPQLTQEGDPINPVTGGLFNGLPTLNLGWGKE